MTIWNHRISLVPPTFIPLAQGLSGALSGPANALMWKVEIEKISAPGVTVYGCSNGPMEDTFANLLPLDVIDPKTLVMTRVSPGQPDQIYAACQATVPPPAVTLAQIQAMLAAVIVVDADPFATLAALGLRIKPGAPL